MTILSLPDELLDNVVSEIELPSDLLHLALVSSRFSNLIIPRHLQYRWIRCPSLHSTNDLDLWKTLAYNRSLAGNVRYLGVGCHTADALSPVPDLPSDQQAHDNTLAPASTEQEDIDGIGVAPTHSFGLSCERWFERALGNMVNLVDFKWGAFDPSVPQTVALAKADNVWNILASIPTLRYLEVNDMHEDFDVPSIYSGSVRPSRGRRSMISLLPSALESFLTLWPDLECARAAFVRIPLYSAHAY